MVQRMVLNNNVRISKFFLKSSTILFIVLFGPILNFSGHEVNAPRLFILFILLVSILSILYYKRYILYYKNELAIISISLIFILVYSLFNFLQFSDPYMLKVIINLIAYFIVAIGLVKLFARQPAIYNNIFDAILFITAINSLIILFMAFNVPFRELVQSHQKLIPLLELAGDYRMVSLNGDAGASLSFFTCLGAISYFYTSLLKKNIKFIMFLIILSSLIFIGRTGIMFFLLYLFFIYQVFLFKKLNFLGTILGNLILIICLYIFLEFITNIFYNVDLDPALWTSLSPIVEMYTSDSGMPRVVEFIIDNFLFLPKGTNELLFGVIGLEAFDGNVLGYRSDSGYIKMIFSIGLVGQILYILHYLVLMGISIHYLKYDKRFTFPIIAILLISIFHIKELGFGVVSYTFLVYISIFSLLYNLKYEKFKECLTKR